MFGARMLMTQLTGFAGTALLVFSFQCKGTRKLFFLQLAGNLLYFFHFLLLRAFTGCVSVLAGISYNLFLAGKWDWMRRKHWAVVLIGLQVVLTVFTWNNGYSILPLVANISFIISGWTEDIRYVRLANLLVYSPCWLIYDYSVGSVAGIVCEILMLFSTVCSMIRYRNQYL